ncbi:uncharacterized protein QC761_120640 [Podospora bellae-mahoneyi]|uniref:Uncharacterized protein n=1 Tax=Podospora bellae-mahoneyi TaxID=2093777 RepID=A0ABR0G1N1_9PEZI|nr:hypothetical protein QC761_120640 [Podospora bellae-mahoneyi]
MHCTAVSGPSLRVHVHREEWFHAPFDLCTLPNHKGSTAGFRWSCSFLSRISQGGAKRNWKLVRGREHRCAETKPASQPPVWCHVPCILCLARCRVWLSGGSHHVHTMKRNHQPKLRNTALK